MFLTRKKTLTDLTTPPDLAAKFKKLTLAQHKLMTFQDSRTSKSSWKTCDSLRSLGLAVPIGVAGLPSHFEVPIPIHMAYCKWCSEQEESKAGA